MASGFLITDNEVGLIKQYCGAVAVSWYSRFMDGKESNQETIDAVERLVKSGCTTMIHTFNMHDTLNKPAKNKVSAITVPIVKLPTRLVALEFKPGSDNTVEMYLDNGWQLSFRIHNASTKVEPSLKFDVQFVSMPMEVLNIECRWN